jgi:CheY-like chemotaxis protein
VLAFLGEHLHLHLPLCVDPCEQWLTDLVRLEMARIKAFHAHDAQPLPLEQVQALLGQPQALESAQWQFLPYTVVLASSGPVHDVWAAAHTESRAIRAGQAQAVLVTRHAWDVVVLDISLPCAHFIRLLMDGKTLHQAVELTAAAFPEFVPVEAMTLLLRQPCLAGFFMPTLPL